MLKSGSFSDVIGPVLYRKVLPFWTLVVKRNSHTMSSTASPSLSTLMVYFTSSPKLWKLGPPAGSSSGIQFPTTVTGSCEIARASRWLDAPDGARVPTTATSANVAARPPTVMSLRNLDNCSSSGEDGWTGRGGGLRVLLSSGLDGIGAEHPPGVAQRADDHREARARALDRDQPGPGADLGAEGGHVGLRLDGGVEALGGGHRPAAPRPAGQLGQVGRPVQLGPGLEGGRAPAVAAEQPPDPGGHRLGGAVVAGQLGPDRHRVGGHPPAAVLAAGPPQLDRAPWDQPGERVDGRPVGQGDGHLGPAVPDPTHGPT